MMNNKIKNISEISVLTALTIVITLIIVIPLPSNSGYLNLSDALIILSANLTFPLGGMLVGMISGAICDLITGYTTYIPFTIIAKGVEGFLAGYLFKKIKNKNLKYISLFISGLIMGCIYFIPDFIFFGFSGAILNLPLNILQGFVGATIATIIISIFNKSKKQIVNE